MGETTKFLLNAVAVVAIVALVLRLFFVEIFVVQDNGMAPTLVYGDEVLLWKGANVDMANVVVCEHPARPHQLVVSRAVAFAGHRIHTDRFGTLLVDDDRTVQEGGTTVRFYDVTRKEQSHMGLGRISYFGRHDHEFFVERGVAFQLRSHLVARGVFLLGDNRSETSFDSRAFGDVDPARCLGQVFMRWKPAPSQGDDIDHHILELIE